MHRMTIVRRVRARASHEALPACSGLAVHPAGVRLPPSAALPAFRLRSRPKSHQSAALARHDQRPVFQTTKLHRITCVSAAKMGHCCRRARSGPQNSIVMESDYTSSDRRLILIGSGFGDSFNGTRGHPIDDARSRSSFKDVRLRYKGNLFRHVICTAHCSQLQAKLGVHGARA